MCFSSDVRVVNYQNGDFNHVSDILTLSVPRSVKL